MSETQAGQERYSMFKKADVILSAVLITAGILMSIMISSGMDEGSYVELTVNGRLLGEYPIDKDQVKTIKQGEAINVLEIKDGKVRMKTSNCNGHDCISKGAVSMSGETVVCLPHKVVVEIKGKEDGFDALAQ